MLPKSHAPLTEASRALLLLLRDGDVAVKGLTHNQRTTMRALMSRGLASPVDVDGVAKWRITEQGDAADLTPHDPPLKKDGPKVKNRRTTWHGDGNGLKCPECESVRLYVTDTRDHRGTRRRRRRCKNGHRFWTIEVLSNYRADVGDIVHPEEY